MALAHSPRIVTDGLVLCLDAGNTKSYPGSGATWTDLSGNGNNGTLENGVGFDGGNGGSLSFDGVNDHVIITNASSLIPKFDWSYDCWFNLTTTIDPSYGQSFIGNWGINGNYGFSDFDLRKSGNNIVFIYYTISNVPQFDIVAVYNFQANKWDNLSVTKQGNTYNFYKNGELINSITSSLPVYDGTATTLYIGREGNFFSMYNGKMSSIKIYNRALTASEVQQNFNALRGRYGI